MTSTKVEEINTIDITALEERLFYCGVYKLYLVLRRYRVDLAKNFSL